MTSDVKQEHLPCLTPFYAALYENSEKNWPSDQNNFQLVQELGRHLQWSKDIYSILKQRKMSRTLHVNIFIFWFISYVQTDLAKL